MKIWWILLDILIEMSPETYKEYVMHEKTKKVLYVRMIKVLYDMMITSVLCYKKFCKDIESIGCEVNPYDNNVANKMVDGKQYRITWHVDDVKTSYVNTKLNEEFTIDAKANIERIILVM